MGVRNFFKEGLETRVRTIGKGLVLGLSAFATLAALGSAAEAGGVFANGGSGNLYADSSYHSQTYSRPNYNWWQLKRATEEYRRQRERTRIIERSRAINDCGLYANSGTVNEPALFANSGSHSSTWIGRTIERRVEENTGRETARTAFSGRTFAEAAVRAAPRPREERKEKEVTITEDENNHIIFVKGESEPIIIPKRKMVESAAPVAPVPAPVVPSRPDSPKLPEEKGKVEAVKRWSQKYFEQMLEVNWRFHPHLEDGIDNMREDLLYFNGVFGNRFSGFERITRLAHPENLDDIGLKVKFRNGNISYVPVRVGEPLDKLLASAEKQYELATGKGALTDGILSIQEIEEYAPGSPLLQQLKESNVHQLEIYRTKDGKEYKVIALFSDGKLDLYNLRGKERELFDFFNKEKESEAKEGEKEERRADGDEKEEEKDKDVEKKDREYEIAITGREKEEERKKPHFSPFSTIRRDYLSARDYEAVVRHLDYVEEELDVEDGDSLDKLIERYKAHLRGQELGEIAKDLPLRQRIQAAIDADVSAAERSGNKRFATLMRQNAQYAQASSVKAIDLRKAHLEQLLRTADMNTELKKRVQHDVANCEIYMRIYQNYINIITNDQKGLEEDYEWFRRKDKELLDNDLEETGYTAYARFMLAVSEQDREKRISALKGIFDRAEWLEDIYLDWLIPSVSTSQGSWTDSSGKEYNYRIDPQLRQRILRLLSSDLYNEASLMKKEHRLQSAADLCNSFLRQASLRNIVEGSWITAGVDAVTDFVFKIFDPEWYKITPREMKELRKLQEFISANPKNENVESIRSRIAYLKKKQDVHDGLLLLDDAKRNIQHNTRAGYDSALSYARQAFTLLEESSWESDARSLLEEIAGKQKRFRENDANIRKTAERVAQFADEAEKVEYQRILMLHITDRKGTELLEAGKRFLQRHPDSEHRLPVMGAIANAYFIMKNQEAFIETLEAMVSADSELKSSYARHAYRLLNDRKYNPYGNFDDARSSLSWRRVGYVFGIDDNTADWRSAREPISLAAHVAAKGLDGLKSLGVSYLISTGFRFPGAVFGDAVDNTRKINEGLHALQNPNLSKQRRAEINYSLASEFERKEDYSRALLHYSQAMMYGYSDAESAIERLEAKTKRSVGDERKTVEAERRFLEERARLNEFFRFSGKEVRGFPRLLGEDGLNIDTTYIDGEHRNGEIADVDDAVIVRRQINLDVSFADGKTRQYAVTRAQLEQLINDKTIPSVHREYLLLLTSPQVMSKGTLNLPGDYLRQNPAFAKILGIDPLLLDQDPANGEITQVSFSMQDLARIRFYKREEPSLLQKYVAEPFGAVEYDTVIEEFPLAPGISQRINAVARNIEIELMQEEADSESGAVHKQGRFNGLFLGAGSSSGFGGANYGYVLPNGSIAVAVQGGIDFKGRPFYTLTLDLANEKTKTESHDLSLQVSQDWEEHEDEEDKKDGRGKIALSSVTSRKDSSEIREVSYRFHGADEPRFGARIVRIQVDDHTAVTYGIDFKRKIGGKFELSFVGARNDAAKEATNKALRFMEMTGIIPNRNRSIYATMRIQGRDSVRGDGEMGVILYPANIFGIQGDDGVEGIVRGVNPAFFVSCNGTEGVAVGGQFSPLGIIPGLRKFPLDLYVEYNVKSKKWDVYPVFTIDYGKTMPDIHRYIPRK